MTKMADIKGTIYNGMGGHYAANNHQTEDGRRNRYTKTKLNKDGNGNSQHSDAVVIAAIKPTIHILFTDWVSKLPFDIPTICPLDISNDELKSQCNRINSRKVYYVVRIGNMLTRLS